MVVIKRAMFWRVADGLLTRVILTPVILAIFMMVIVYASTHPRAVRAMSTPDSYGVYYKSVNIFTIDNQRLNAWYIPPINAEEVAFDAEGMLHQKWPGVVLCHGLGASHDQYLPLAATLHRAGFAVLMMDMRGEGESDPAAVTYGLRERLDVLAGVKFMRETVYVDETKVCVVGHDIGATAALQATTLDSSITAVVADGLWQKFEDRATSVFSHPASDDSKWATANVLPTKWLAPLYTLTFEIAVRDQLSQLEPQRVLRNIRAQPVLFVARSGDDFAPVQDVLKLSTESGGKHDVIIQKAGVEDDDVNKRITAFLVQATGWKGPKFRGAQQIEELRKNQVK
jgi:pimeloyl-ACP methyl ester carboxylesterase